ncbi:MAG: hypothetical protein Q8O55_00805 [Dehalococcoidales bacterium]|nr:hypothetical protein [Dehalococcoidales bacterium]
MPDPVIWQKSGMLSPTFRADSLGILDPDSVSKLIYFHDTSAAFAGAQNNRTASFKVRLKAAPIDNGSPAFNDHVAAGRVILDDGVKRAELQFAREPNAPFARIIKLGGNAPGLPIPFIWDNGIFATYEISRATDGTMTVNIVSSDPAIPPASKTYLPDDLAATDGAAMFAWGAAEIGGGGFGFSEAIGRVDSVETNFEVEIDIKPGSDPNSINPKSKGVIPVAILTTPDFDASTVDPDTVRFGPDEAEAVHWALEDVDRDGDTDMILHFKTQDTGIQAGDTEATLTGEPVGGQVFAGTDSVRTVGK